MLQALLVALLALLVPAGCTDEVQLARERIVRPPAAAPSGPSANAGSGGPANAEPVVARDDYCSGAGSPVARDLLVPGPDSPSCLQPAPNAFRYALCTCADLVLSGGLATDAFDSSRAPYAPGQVGGSVGVNGRLLAPAWLELLGALSVGSGPLPITAPFEVAGTLRAQGDLSIAAPDARIGRDLWVQGEIIAIGGSASVAGDVYQPPGRVLAPNLSVGGQLRTQPFELPLPCPCAPEQQLDIAAIVARGSARSDNDEAGVASDALYTTASEGPLELPCGRYAFDGGFSDGDARIVARGRTAVFIHGDLAINGRFVPDLGPDGELDVFVDGSLLIAPGSELGTRERPGALRLYVAGEGDLVLTGPLALYAGLYAPNATVYLTAATQETFGALFLAALYGTGEARLHYDAALLHPVQLDPDQACGERTPNGGCQTDADCTPPFICQAGSCSARLL